MCDWLGVLVGGGDSVRMISARTHVLYDAAEVHQSRAVSDFNASRVSGNQHCKNKDQISSWLYQAAGICMRCSMRASVVLFLQCCGGQLTPAQQLVDLDRGI